MFKYRNIVVKDHKYLIVKIQYRKIVVKDHKYLIVKIQNEMIFNYTNTLNALYLNIPLYRKIQYEKELL